MKMTVWKKRRKPEVVNSSMAISQVAPIDFTNIFQIIVAILGLAFCGFHRLRMWPFISKSKSPEYYKRRWRELWKLLVPLQGEAETWQGEIVRIVGNAEDEANRNGFINWDEEDARDMDLFVERLCADSIFDSSTKGKIRICAEKIKIVGADFELPLPSEEDWDYLFSRAVDWCDAHPEPIPMRDVEDYIGHD